MDIKLSPEELRKVMRDINRGFLFDLRGKITRAIPHLESVLPAEIKQRIQSSNVIEALQNDNLRYDLGILPEEAIAIANKIPDIIAKAVQVRITIPQDNKISLIVEMVKDSYDDILSIPEASFIQTYTNKEPKEIKWLDWLLTKGNTIVVADYCVWYTPGNPNSRSGGAVMAKPGSFRIPPAYAGTLNDNFITRALEGIEEFIFEEIKRFI